MKRYILLIFVLFISMSSGGCITEVHMAPRKTTPVPTYQPPQPEGSTSKLLTGPPLLSQIECESPANWQPRDGKKWVCAPPDTRYIWSGSGLYPWGMYGMYGYPYMYGGYGAFYR